VPVANRVRAEFDRLIGFFVNMVVLRIDRSDERPTGSSTWRELVRRVRRECLAAYAHQELPFDQLVEALRPPREPGVNPYFQVNFTVDEVSGPDRALPGLRVSDGSEVGAGTAKFEQSWLVETDRGEVWISVDYATQLFDHDTVAATVEEYRALLRSMVDDPDAPVQPVAPARVEDVLAEMWSHAFDGAPVGEHDDFFELGGYSVLAAQMCLRIREMFAIDLPLRVFFENSTIAEIADRIRSAEPDLAIAGTIGSGPGDSTVDSLGDLLAEIESLSDDEVAAVIHAGDERARDGGGGPDG
jgi:mycobactin peptide synthetase MbtE